MLDIDVGCQLELQLELLARPLACGFCKWARLCQSKVYLRMIGFLPWPLESCRGGGGTGDEGGKGGYSQCTWQKLCLFLIPTLRSHKVSLLIHSIGHKPILNPSSDSRRELYSTAYWRSGKFKRWVWAVGRREMLLLTF